MVVFIMSLPLESFEDHGLLHVYLFDDSFGQRFYFIHVLFMFIVH